VHVSALERCVGDVEAFLNQHWARGPLLRARHNDGTFDDLASLDDLDRMVSSLGLRASSLRMVKDGQTLPPSSYASPPPARSRGTEQIVNPAFVYNRYSEGATIVLESLHRYWAPITDFSRDLEMSLGHRLQVNAYITPPGSQGFDVHRDDHDVFVLQVSGGKHWIVYADDDDEKVLIDTVLERGAALYIPKGFPHAATTGEQASAHLTVGILTHDSSDVIAEIAKLASEEPAFAARLDAKDVADPESLRTMVGRHVEEFRTWLDKIDTDELAERVARRLLSTTQPILRGQLAQLDLISSIDEATTLRRRRGQNCTIFRTERAVRVLLADRELEMPPIAAQAMEFIADRDRIRVNELHPLLDPESALVLARRLVREGLLEVVVDG
jgi:ribosomal protein L16 Arg81 hydroxylase